MRNELRIAAEKLQKFMRESLPEWEMVDAGNGELDYSDGVSLIRLSFEDED